MKKLLYGVMVFAVISITSLVYVDRSVADDTSRAIKSICSQMNISVLQRHVPITNKAKIVSKRDIYGMCEMIVDIPQDRSGASEQVSIYATPDFVISGEMYSNKKRETQDTIDKMTAKIFNELRNEIDNAACLKVAAKGKPKQTLYMFSSPSCPACQYATSELVKLLETNRGTELKVLFFAGGEARNKAITAVCENMSFNAYAGTNWESKMQQKPPMCVEGIKTVDKASAIARKLGITGVPYFFTAKGESIHGADIEAIKKAMQG